MDTKTPISPKPTVRRLLPVVGFFAIIIGIAWLTVQVVNVAPSAFTSLASLSAGITEYKNSLSPAVDGPLVVRSDVASTTSGTPITLSWDKDGRLGRYAFSHNCIDGMTVDIVDTEGLRTLSCGTRYDLGDKDNITIIVESVNQPQIELPYIISFMRTNDTEPVRIGESKVTVINKDAAEPDDSTDGAVLGETDSTESEAPEPTVTKPEYTLTLPVSDPNGFVDLKATFIATGNISGQTFKSGPLKQDAEGALRFEIQNIGTKTSARWSYSVLLPDSDTYVSPLQAPLQPTERVIISIGFPTDTDSSHTFAVIVAEANDTKLNNNTFRQVTKLIR